MQHSQILQLKSYENMQLVQTSYKYSNLSKKLCFELLIQLILCLNNTFSKYLFVCLFFGQKNS